MTMWSVSNSAWFVGKAQRHNKKEKSSAPTDNQIYWVLANQFSPS